jgi:hypothetical protein
MRPGSTVARGLLARLEATLGRPSSTRNIDDAREVRCRGMADGEMVMAKGRERLHGWTPGDTTHRPGKVDTAAADRSGGSHWSGHVFRRRLADMVVGDAAGGVLHDEDGVRDAPQPREEDGTASAGWLTERRRSMMERHSARRLWRGRGRSNSS